MICVSRGPGLGQFLGRGHCCELDRSRGFKVLDVVAVAGVFQSSLCLKKQTAQTNGRTKEYGADDRKSERLKMIKKKCPFYGTEEVCAPGKVYARGLDLRENEKHELGEEKEREKEKEREREKKSVFSI